jgi:hypothetical protein
MNKEQRFRHVAYSRFNALCADHRDTLETTQGGKQAVADLRDSVTAVDQRSQERERRLEEERVAVKDCLTWRRILRGVLQAIVEISHSVVPVQGPAEVMHVPGKVNDELFLAEARAIQDKVKQYESDFLAQGLHPDVLKNLADGIDRLAAARLAREKARTLRVAAGKSIREDLTTAKGAMRLLHTIVVTTPGVDSNVVNAFRAAKRVGPSKAKDEAPAQPDPVPVPTPKTA